MARLEDEDALLRSVALQNAKSILVARQRAEEELLRTREALHASQERLRAALSAAGTGTFRWNVPAGIVEWDGNLDRLFGLETPPAPLGLETFLSSIHPDDRSTVAARFRECAERGTGVDLEFRVLWPDGSVRWIHAKAKGSQDPSGATEFVTGACADITSRKDAEESTRQSEQRLRAIFNHAAVGIAVAGLDGHFADANDKFSSILQYSKAELQAMTFLELTHPDDVEPTRTSVARLLAGEIQDYSVEKRYRRKDGTFVWSLTTVTLLRDAAGRPAQFLGVIEDITPRKHAEEALREETRTLELLYESGQVLASTLDLQSLLQAVTDAATELSGAAFGAFFYNTTDENGDSYLLYTLSGAPREAFEKFGKPRASSALFGPTFQGAAAVIRLDDVTQDPRYGTLEPHRGMPKGHLPVRSYLAVPVRSRSGEVIGGLFFGHPRPGVFTDRSERLISAVANQAGIAIDNARLYEAAQRAAEERKTLLDSERAARSAAERLSEVKDQFLATLSHELRTPLNAILGWARVLRGGAKDEADLHRGLDTIERNARVQTQLIDDLLDMSRITSGKLRLDIQPVLPAAFVEAAIATVQPAAEAKGIRLEPVLDQGSGPVSGDANRLQQVVWNLLSNAIKFTPKGGKVQVVVRRVESHVEISVADTGAGIRPEFLPHLFERFRQGDASTTRKYGGLGLGLSIVKSLVELHGGSVTAHSAGEGLGTTVTVSLPLSVVHRHGTPEQRRRTEAAPPPPFAPAAELAGLTIVVVDDAADARVLIKRVLEDAGAEVLTAGTAEEAIGYIERHRPHVLVSDIGMPEADGFELLRRVRALGPGRGGRIPAIALTAFARSEDRTRALRAGFLVHVSKPVDPPELIATVASVAGRVDE